MWTAPRSRGGPPWGSRRSGGGDLVTAWCPDGVLVRLGVALRGIRRGGTVLGRGGLRGCGRAGRRTDVRHGLGAAGGGAEDDRGDGGGAGRASAAAGVGPGVHGCSFRWSCVVVVGGASRRRLRLQGQTPEGGARIRRAGDVACPVPGAGATV